MNLDFSKLDGLLPAVVTDHTTGRVLMVGFMNEDAWQRTLASGNVTFYSRSRNKLWMKGESSGHVLKVREIRTDCDQDTVVISADNLGPGVCHDGYESCFYRRLKDGQWVTTDKPTYDPKAVYESAIPPATHEQPPAPDTSVLSRDRQGAGPKTPKEPVA